jgi:hypothetical protein
MSEEKKSVVKKGFLGRLLDALDKKMQEKAASCGSCCCGPKSDNAGDKKCC